MARFVVLDVDGVLHPLSEKGLPANAAFEDLSKRADEELEDDGSCVYPAVAGKQRIRNFLSGACRVPVAFARSSHSRHTHRPPRRVRATLHG